jgi:L-fucose/D-arabinose isomerase
MANSRLRGSLPKVGIRPTIDGRYGGVRESLEDFTMAMATSVAALISETLRHASGEPVECVIADTCIGGVAEAADAAEKFKKEGVGVSLTVTPCWCYGSETMDMDPQIPKAIWGFNGTDRPGAVYLAATLAGHNQKGLPSFGIYGQDVQDLGDTTIPADIQDKLLRFVRAGITVATMKGKSYLAMGGTSMGIAGSVVDPDFLQKTLGLRTETIDMTEFVGRMNKGIYDHEEFDRALAWTKANCPEGQDVNPSDKQRTREQKDEDWATSIKMTLIARDLMVGNPKLAEMGYLEQAQGHNAIAGGFQGQRQWTDHFPNGDFLEAILTSSFDWNGIRQPYIVATENDALNGVSMLVGHLLTGTAQLFSDVRTYWSPDAVERVTGHRPETGFLHLINSGPSALDWTAEAKGGVPAWWNLDDEDVENSLKATQWCPSDLGYFPAGGWSTDFTTKGGLPVTMFRINLVDGLGDHRPPAPRPRRSRRPHQPDLAHHLVRPAPRRQRRLPRRLLGHGPLGCQPRCHRPRPHRRGPHHAGRHAPHPGRHAQRRPHPNLPPHRLAPPRLRAGRSRRRLPRLRQLRPALQVNGPSAINQPHH